MEPFIKDGDDIDKFLSLPEEEAPVDLTEHFKQKEMLGDNGIVCVDYGNALGYMAGLFDFADMLVMFYDEPEKMDALYHRYHRLVFNVLKKLLRAGAGPLFRLCGPELATPPYLPREKFEQYSYEKDRELIDLIHQHHQLARIHSHGNIKTVLPYWIDMGIDALDPVEAPPSGDITLREVKQLTKGKICLLGNIQLKDLEQLTPLQIREVVRHCMDDAMEDGGYIIMPTAAPLNADLSPRTEENYYAFIDAALEYGKY